MLILPLFILGLLATSAQAQQALDQQPVSSTTDSDTRVIAETSYAVAARGGNQKIWSKVTWETNSLSGEPTAKTNSFIELATGSAHLVNGAWIDSSDQIEITKTGAQATNSQHQVSFLGNINSSGAIDLTLPEGDKHLVSSVIGLSYEDPATGKSVLIGEIKDSFGQLLPSGSQVLYPDAFTDLEADAVKADVLYENKISGLEQLVVIRQQLPPPSEWGLSDESSLLQVITAFENPPQPTITESKIDGVIDQHLDFGIVQMGRGVAFALGSETNTIPVTKQWLVLDGRQCLVEQTPFSLLQPLLKDLPGPTGHAGLLHSPDGVLHRVASRHLLPERNLAQTSPSPAGIAAAKRSHEAGSEKSTPSPIGWERAGVRAVPIKPATVAANTKGVAIDWSAVVSQANMTFQSDTTYYVSSNVTLSGTTTFEGCSVIKFSNSPTAGLTMSGSFVANTSPYRIAILTSKNDNSCGDTIPGSTGSPTNYNGATYISGGSTAYNYFRFSYAGQGIYSSQNNGACVISHCQFLNCGTAITLSFTDTYLRNVLFSKCGTALYIFNNTAHGEHVTADSVNSLLGGLSSQTGYMTNSILTAVTNLGATNVTLFNCTTNSSGSGIYQTVGAADYYLANGSTNRNIGATNINSTLLSALKQKTTYPPIVYSNATISIDTSFSPQAQRDTDIPDLGYHYDPIDYAFGGTTANGNVTFSKGTAVGWFRTSSGWQHAGHGLHMADAKTVTFDGTEESRNYWVRCNVTQEGCNGLWQGGYGPGGITGWAWPDIANSPQIVARFTRFSMLAGDGNHYRDDWGWLIANATSCEYYAGGAGFYNGGHHYTNCLFLRVPIGLGTDHAPSSFSMRNCTVIGGLVSVGRSNDGTNAPAVIRETAFDGSTVSTSGAGVNVTYYDYNAFLQGGNRTTPNGAHDQLVTNFNWQTSWLGSYYLPTNSSLINTGGVTADLIGLYHFTTQTNQQKEMSSTVDIGFHFVAINPSTGLPYDADGDGIPDYLEDANGNGVFDSGETDWTTYNSPNGLAAGSGLQVFTPLK